MEGGQEKKKETTLVFQLFGEIWGKGIRIQRQDLLS